MMVQVRSISPGNQVGCPKDKNVAVVNVKKCRLCFHHQGEEDGKIFCSIVRQRSKAINISRDSKRCIAKSFYCLSCGSPRMEPTGVILEGPGGKRESYQCQLCGKFDYRYNQMRTGSK